MNVVEGRALQKRGDFALSTLAALALFGGPSGCASAAKGSSAEGAAEATRVLERVIAADNARDLEAVLDCYTDDVVWLPPSGDAVEGKEAIARRYRELFGSNELSFAIEVFECHVVDALAYARGGTFGMLMPIGGGARRKVDDKFLAVLEHGEHGWRIARLAWSPRAVEGVYAAVPAVTLASAVGSDGTVNAGGSAGDIGSASTVSTTVFARDARAHASRGASDEIGDRGATASPFASHFERAGVSGTFLLYDLARDRLEVHDAARADRPFLPASTYKILNALVALETGAVEDEHEVIAWDGVDRGSDGWNRDHDLESAFKASAVWFYQAVARRIGAERMQHWVELAGYGNRDTSGGIDRFWLDGALRITPREELEFLVRLYANELPFSRRAMDVVKRVMIVEEGPGYVLRAKTGWAHPFAPDVGWYVGWVERDDGPRFFVINIDIVGEKDADARRTITRAILAERGLVPEASPR